MRRANCVGAILAGLALCALAFPASAQEPEKLTLKRAVALALQNSRELALARVQYTMAQNQAGVERADFRPNLYTGSGAAYSNGFPLALGGEAPSVFELSYKQALFNPPLRGQLHAAEIRAENQKLELERTRDAVIMKTATEYLELAKVRQSLELLRNERTSAQKILDATRERAAAGLELPIEVTRGQLNLAKNEQRIVQLESRDQILSEQLRDLTGTPADQPLQVAAEDLPQTTEQPAGELIGLALANNNVLKEAENERIARQKILSGERGGYWPTIDLVGQYSILSRINNYDVFFRRFQRNNVSVGLQIRIPLFSAKTSANVALARSELTAGELDVSAKRQGLRLDVEQKVRGMREFDAAREVARLDLKLAQESLAITQSKFDEGRASLREVEQDRLEESEKWVAFLDADFARQRAQLSLLQTTGQLAKVFQ
jgi:outer membrane protein TolC